MADTVAFLIGSFYGASSQTDDRTVVVICLGIDGPTDLTADAGRQA